MHKVINQTVVSEVVSEVHVGFSPSFVSVSVRTISLSETYAARCVLETYLFSDQKIKFQGHESHRNFAGAWVFALL